MAPETAELIVRVTSRIRAFDENATRFEHLYYDKGDSELDTLVVHALAALAQEVERLQSALGSLVASEASTERRAFTDGLNECRHQYKPQVEALEKRAEAAEARVRELEAEIDTTNPHLIALAPINQNGFADDVYLRLIEESIGKLLLQLAAKEAATIDRCAQVAESLGSHKWPSDFAKELAT